MKTREKVEQGKGTADHLMPLGYFIILSLFLSYSLSFPQAFLAGMRPGWLALRPAWLDLRPSWLPLRHTWLARSPAWLDPEAMGGRTDVRTEYGRRESFPVLQDFVLNRES